MKLTCPDCGEVQSANIDGYFFGGRILEGVYFKITVNPCIGLMAETLPEDEEYLSGLNVSKWLNEAVRFAKNYDNMVCPSCDECGVYVAD